MKPRPDAHGSQLVLEPAHVARDHGPHERVETDGREALVLPVLRQDVGRNREERLWKLLAHDAGDSLLVLRIQEREEEADGDGLDARLLQLPDLLARFLLVERDQYRPVLRDPLGNRQPVAAPHDRIPLPGEVLVVREVERLLVAGDVEDVAVALGRDHPDLRAVVLDHDVRGDRRPVEHLVELVGWDAGVSGEVTNALDGSLRRIRRRRRQLVDEDLPRLVVDIDEIGERPPDVDPYAFHPSISFASPYGVRTIFPKKSRLSMRSIAAFVSASGNVESTRGVIWPRSASSSTFSNSSRS